MCIRHLFVLTAHTFMLRNHDKVVELDKPTDTSMLSLKSALREQQKSIK